MRVLFVSEQFPYPLDTGGNVRTFNLLKGLASAHAVTLIATQPARLAAAQLRAVAELCETVRLVKAPAAGVRTDARAFAATLGRRTPFILARHTFTAVRREIAAALADGASCSTDAPVAGGTAAPFSAVHFNHLDATLYDQFVPGCVRRIVDQHNVVSNQVCTTAMHEPSRVRRLLLKREYRKLRRFEVDACNRMDRCFTCSEVDARALTSLGVTAPIAVIPNGVDLSYFAPTDAYPASRDIVFLGTLDYGPCERGVWFCCREILPLLHRELPELRLVVIGRNPAQRLRQLAAADARIVLTGRVEDVRPHVLAARVFVVPLLSGSGTRLKILEAMAMGVPVVSTSIGAEGIDARHGEHMMFADEPAAFARAVLVLIRNPQLAARLRMNGRRLVEEKFGWPSICRALLREYDALAG